MNNFNDLLILLEKIIPSNADVVDSESINEKDFNDFLKSNKIVLYLNRYFFYFSNRVFKLKLETEGDILVPMSGSTVKENSVVIDFSYIPITPKNSADLFEIFNSGKWIQSKVKHDDSKGFWSILIKALSHYTTTTGKTGDEGILFSFVGSPTEFIDTIRKKDNDKIKKEIRLNHIPFDIISYALRNKSIDGLPKGLNETLEDFFNILKPDIELNKKVFEKKDFIKFLENEKDFIKFDFIDFFNTIDVLLNRINDRIYESLEQALSEKIKNFHNFIIALSKNLKNISNLKNYTSNNSNTLNDSDERKHKLVNILNLSKDLYDSIFLLKVYFDIQKTFAKWNGSNFPEVIVKIKKIFNNMNNKHEGNIDIYNSFKNDFLKFLHDLNWKSNIDKVIFKDALNFAIRRACKDGYFQTQEDYAKRLDTFVNKFFERYPDGIPTTAINVMSLSLNEDDWRTIGYLIRLTEKGQQASLNRREQLYWRKLINDGLTPQYVDGQIYFTVK